MTVEASQVVEEYAETIYNISMEGDAVIGARLAERFRVAPPTVTETLKRMTRDGLVEMDAKRQVTLTPQGVELAERGAAPAPPDRALPGGHARHAVA